MSTKHFTANVISATKVVPDGIFKDSKASGVWDINEALDLIKGGNWPNVANVNPAAFVDALFQTHLYDGTGSSQTITTNVDLSNNEGLVWLKKRSGGTDHQLYDTVRGATKDLHANGTNAEGTRVQGLTAFTSSGFTVGTAGNENDSGEPFVSWNFRSAPKFFDVVTYSGSGSAQNISHNLGSVPGMILVKGLSGNESDHNWAIFHRGADASAPEDKYLILNGTAAAADDSAWWNDTAPTSSVFTVGSADETNEGNTTYVAYLFAHNDDDGGFGEPGDQDIIKCGTYTGNNSTTGPVIDLGFEPQWIFIKHIDSGGGGGDSSFIFDNMRGVATGGGDPSLSPNAAQDEQNASNDMLDFNASGFQLKRANSNVNGDGNNYIYMAIRRGGMQTPTAASDVFTIHNRDGEPNSSELNLGNTHLIDMVLSANRYDAGTTYRYLTDRLRGDDKLLLPNALDAESTGSNYIEFDRNTGNAIPSGGFGNNSGGTSADSVFWMWKRARGYFDVATYTGTGSARTVTHNLGVAPEMIWIKNRGATENWVVYHSGIDSSTPEDYYLRLNTTSARIDIDGGAGNRFNRTAPTASVFTVGTDGDVNGNGVAYISYHFATVANVSKVGSFTQSGATNVACGFTGDTPSFILIKRIDVNDSTSNWWIFDSVRGIVAGNDKSLYLNTTGAEVTNADIVDPYSGGFATTSTLTNGDYIFYAIASIS